jgi:pimeloyl-ACP methyl ester carboxylesterase
MKEDEQARLPCGRMLGYAEYGDPAGRPVMFFHGWPSSRYQGKLLHAGAVARGLRVIAPDRPGIGLSDACGDRGFSQWPADVAALADRIGVDRFHVCGMSGGGPYALATAAEMPQRVIATAVLCGAPPLGDQAVRAQLHPVYRTLAGLHGLRRAAAPAAIGFSRWVIARGMGRAPLTWFLHSLPQHDREAITEADCWDSVTRSYLEGVRRGPGAVIEEGELYLSPWDFSPEEIRVPVGFWHGLADRNLPCSAARLLAARVPTADCYWIEDEGHYSLPLRYREQVLDWIHDHV